MLQIKVKAIHVNQMYAGISATNQLQKTFPKPAGTEEVRAINEIWELR